MKFEYSGIRLNKHKKQVIEKALAKMAALDTTVIYISKYNIVEVWEYTDGSQGTSVNQFKNVDVLYGYCVAINTYV